MFSMMRFLFFLLACLLLAANAQALHQQQPFAVSEPAAARFPGHTMLELNDGRWLPSPAFGSGSVWHPKPGQPGRTNVTEAVVSALRQGYRHIDNAASYRNAAEVGDAIRLSGVPRSELFITTKYDRLDDHDVLTEFNLELAKLGAGYVDLLLIHAPPKGQPAKEVWRAFETLVGQGLVKSIGVSNYNQAQIQEILDLPARIKPAVNQIHFEPYSMRGRAELLAFHSQHGIVTQGYSALTPLTKRPGGPVSKVVAELAAKYDISDAQVLLDWVKGKGVGSVTTSGNSQRQREQLAVFGTDFPALSHEDIAAIEQAGDSLRSVW